MKAVIIGLDGVPYSLLQDYMEQGIMNNFRFLARQGRLMPMTSTLPEVSSVAWASFMTGQGPAGHGIFGFTEIDRQTYEYAFPNFHSLKAPTFWEELGAPAVVLNVPQTYPAKALNGVLVSGFVALNLEQAVYPKRIYSILKDMDYRLDVQSQLAAKDPKAFFEDLFYTFHKRVEAIKYFFTEEEWDIFLCAITETDRLHHFFFDSARGGQYHEEFVRFYRLLDDFLGEMYGRSQDERGLFLTCSDHGFTSIETEVYVNRYLMDQGFLKIAHGLDLTGITNDSRAFCLDPARVYLHLDGKFARGGVHDSVYQGQRQEIKELFESLTYDGRPVVKQVYAKEEIFAGPYLADAPDLYVLGHPGFDLKSALNKDSVFGRSQFRGCHTYADAHLFIAPAENITLKNELSITDVPTIIKDRIRKRS